MRRRYLFSVAIIIVLIGAIALLGLVRENARKQTVRVSNTCPHHREFRTYDQWQHQVTFPYVGPEAKLQEVKRNYSLVEAGSSEQEVLKAFGAPDFEEEIYPKQLNRPCLGYEFSYYFEKPDEASNGSKDKRIEVFFTPNGKVKWIVGNIGLADKGAPPFGIGFNSRRGG